MKRLVLMLQEEAQVELAVQVKQELLPS